MPTWTSGGTYKLYFGLSATAPTTPLDETMGAYNSVGEIPGDISISRSRDVAIRRTRDDANAQYVHPGDRNESISFEMDLDVEDNAGYQDLQAAYNSDTDGVGASGTLGYGIITDATASHLAWSFEAAVTALNVVIPRSGSIMRVAVTLTTNKDINEGTHA